MKTELTKSEFWRIEGVEWKEITLKDLVEKYKGIQRGPWGGQIKKEIFVKSGYPVYEQGNVIKNNFTHFRYFLTQEKFNEFKNYHAIPGDFLITSAGTMGIIREIPDFAPIGSINQALIRIRINKNKITSEYFLLHFNYLIERVKDEYSKGSAMKNLVSVKVIELLPFIIPYRDGKPDLETQKRIVEYIEACFSRINTLLEKKKNILSQLNELWESTLENAFKPREGEEWRAVRFNHLISKEKFQVGKVKVRNNLNKKGKIPVVDQSQKIISGFLNDEELSYKGPLPLVIFGDHTKIVKYIDFPFIVGADGVKVLLPNKDLLNPKYFYWLLKSVKLPKRGYARHFKFLKQKSYPLPYRNGKPDLERQKEIADYLDKVYEKIKSIKEKVQFQINQLDEMKESILNEVFRYDKGN